MTRYGYMAYCLCAYETKYCGAPYCEKAAVDEQGIWLIATLIVLHANAMALLFYIVLRRPYRLVYKFVPRGIMWLVVLGEFQGFSTDRQHSFSQRFCA